MEKLRPCPFCGRKTIIFENCYYMFSVRCPKCGAVMWGDIIDKTKYPSLDEVVEAWNRRANDGEKVH